MAEREIEVRISEDANLTEDQKQAIVSALRNVTVETLTGERARAAAAGAAAAKVKMEPKEVPELVIKIPLPVEKEKTGIPI